VITIVPASAQHIPSVIGARAPRLCAIRAAVADRTIIGAVTGRISSPLARLV
jgi:hypothetical protein